MSAIEVLLDEPIGTISPDLHGYLLENLGTAIYDGVWVGEDSKIANVGGIRKGLIDRLREIRASVIRWPGGNFADYYDWKDGVGPRPSRPTRTNMWWNSMPRETSCGPQWYDPNAFGTPEFMRLCRLSGGRPFLGVNARSLTPQDFGQWVEYCNAPTSSTTLAQLRARDGDAEPYGVRYWSIGNEAWAFGGNMTVEEYSAVYRRFISSVPNYGVDLAFVACGGPFPSLDMEWNRAFLASCKKSLLPVPIAALSIHYYATNIFEDMPPGQTIEQLLTPSEKDWDRFMPDAIDFDESGWYDVLTRSAKLERIIESYWETIAAFDPAHRIKIAVDEWGAIYKRGAGLSPLNITGRPVTLRDALAAALTLDIFQNHAEQLLVANFTGLINQEGGLFLAEGERFITTPIYEVFRLYAAHQGGLALRAIFNASPISFEHDGRSQCLWGLNGSASIRDDDLTLTVVNPNVSEPAEPSIIIRGGEAISGTVTTLTDTDIHAQNTFDDPDRVKRIVARLEVSGPQFHHRFAPASVSCLSLRLRGG